MSHWAEIDSNNIVIRVLVCNNTDINEGYDWLIENFGGTWIKTSYNNNIRVRFAGIGMYYDEVRDAFYFPKPNDGNQDWFFNEETVQWELPQSLPPIVEEIQLDPNWNPSV